MRYGITSFFLGEDDNFFERVKSNGMEVCRFGPNYSKYMMLPHRKEKPISHLKTLMDNAAKQFHADGINSLNYTTDDVILRPLYTHILVKL